MYCLDSSNMVVFYICISFVANVMFWFLWYCSVLFYLSEIDIFVFSSLFGFQQYWSIVFLFVRNCCICIFVVANVLFGLLQNCWWQQAAAVNGSPKIPNKYQYFKNNRCHFGKKGLNKTIVKIFSNLLINALWQLPHLFLETEYSLLGRHILTFKVVFRISIIFMMSLCCYTFLMEKKYSWSLNCAKLLSAASVWNEWWGENIGNMIESFEAQHKQQPNFEMEEKNQRKYELHGNSLLKNKKWTKNASHLPLFRFVICYFGHTSFFCNISM